MAKKNKKEVEEVVEEVAKEEIPVDTYTEKRLPNGHLVRVFPDGRIEKVI